MMYSYIQHFRDMDGHWTSVTCRTERVCSSAGQKTQEGTWDSEWKSEIVVRVEKISSTTSFRSCVCTNPSCSLWAERLQVTLTPPPRQQLSLGERSEIKKSFLLNPVYMGSSESSLSLSSCREDSVRTGLVGDKGEAEGEGEVGEEVEGDAASSEAPSAPFVVGEPLLVLPMLLGEEESVSHPGAPREDDAFSWESSLDSFLTSSPSILLPSPHRSLSRVGEEGVDEGGWCFLAFLLASLKLARGGRSLTPLRVEPSIAFCNC